MSSSKKTGATIVNRCSIISVLETLKNSLDSENLERFRRSCFGNFLSLPRQKFLAKLAYLALLRMKVGYNKTAVFQIEREEVRFTRRDYYLITGLNFVGDHYLPGHSDIHSTIFGGTDTVYLHNVEEVFLSVCKTSNGRGILTLKLALLWFVYAVLFASHPSNDAVNVKYMHLVDDLAKFNAYPWGLKSYNFFIRNLCKTRDLLVSSHSGGSPLELHGLTFAFQVWFFECAPTLGAYCGNRVEVVGSRVPRLMRWSVDHTRIYKSLVKFFSGTQRFKMSPLIPLNHELEGLSIQDKFLMEKQEKLMLKDGNGATEIGHCMPDLNSTLGAECSTKRYSLRSTTAIVEEGALDGGKPTDQSPYKLTHEEFAATNNELKEMIVNVNDKLDVVLEFLSEGKRRKIDKGKEVVDAETENDNGKVEGQPKSSIQFQTPDSKLPSKDETLPSAKKVQVDFNNTIEDILGCDAGVGALNMSSPYWLSKMHDFFSPDVVILGEKGPTGCTPHDPVDVSSDGGVVSPTRLSIKKEENVVRCINFGDVDVKLKRPVAVEESIQVATELSLAHDPLSPAALESLNLFNAWLTRALGQPRNVNLFLSMGGGIEIPRTLMRKLKERNEWISNVVCDAVMLVFVNMRKQKPEAFLSNWTMVDTFCMNRMMSNELMNAKRALLPYINGEMPCDDGRSWLQTEHVYGMCLVMESHWVACDINLVKREIVVYDSLSKSRNWSLIKRDMEKIRRFVQYQMNLLMADSDENDYFDIGPWELVLYRDAPQQENGDDCGIMALKFLECLMTGNPVDIIIPGDCPKYRESFCAMLFENAVMQV